MIINKEEPRKKILGVGGIRKGGIIKEMGIRRHMDDDGVDSDEELTGYMSDGLGSDSGNDSTIGFGHDVNDLLPPPARTASGPGLGVGSRIEHNEGNDNDDGAVVTTETSEKSSLDVGKGNYDGW